MYSHIKSGYFDLQALISYSITIFMEHFAVIIMLVLATQTLVYIPLFLWAPSPDQLSLLLTLTLVAAVLKLLLALAIITLVAKVVREEPANYSQVMSVAIGKLFKGLIISVLLSIAFILIYVLTFYVLEVLISVLWELGFLSFLFFSLMFLVPGVIFMVYLSFSYQALVVEEVSGLDAMSYSYKVVRGRWWRVFGYLLLLSLIIGAITFLIAAVCSYIPTIGGLLSMYFSDLLLTFSYIALTLLFMHLDHNRT